MADQSQQQPNPVLIWSALVASVLIYCVVAVMITRDAEPREIPVTTDAAITLAAVAMAGASLFVRRMVMAGGSATPAPQAAPERSAAEVATKCIVVWALAESVAIFGLVLTVMGQDASHLPPFALSSLVLLWMSRPAVLLESGRRSF